jgi:hypothetical protein
VKTGDSDQEVERREIQAERAQAHGEEAWRLYRRRFIGRLERPISVQQEVVGDGKAEGTRRRGQVVHAAVLDEHREDRQIDQVSGSSDEEEANQLEVQATTPADRYQ